MQCLETQLGQWILTRMGGNVKEDSFASVVFLELLSRLEGRGGPT